MRIGELANLTNSDVDTIRYYELNPAVLGLTLVAVSLFARNGIIGLIDAIRRRFASRHAR